MVTREQISEVMRMMSRKGRDKATAARKLIPAEKRREYAVKAVKAREAKRKERREGDEKKEDK